MTHAHFIFSASASSITCQNTKPCLSRLTSTALLTVVVPVSCRMLFPSRVLSTNSPVNSLCSMWLLVLRKGQQYLAWNMFYSPAEKWSCYLTSIWLKLLSSTWLLCSWGKIMDLYRSLNSFLQFEFLKVSKLEGLLECLVLFSPLESYFLKPQSSFWFLFSSFHAIWL